MRRPTPLAVAAAAALAGVRARTARAGTGLSGADLHGRTAVVTGAGSGIGRALALLLARRSAFVHVADLDAGRAQAVTHQILDSGGQAVAHTVDVSAAVDALAEQVAQAGGVDVLFNNAGIGHAGNVADTPLSDWQRVIDVNLMGVVHGVHAFVPLLLTQGRPAHIVNTASVAGLLPVPGDGAVLDDESGRHRAERGPRRRVAPAPHPGQRAVPRRDRHRHRPHLDDARRLAGAPRRRDRALCHTGDLAGRRGPGGPRCCHARAAHRADTAPPGRPALAAGPPLAGRGTRPQRCSCQPHARGVDVSAVWHLRVGG